MKLWDMFVNAFSFSNRNEKTTSNKEITLPDNLDKTPLNDLGYDMNGAGYDSGKFNSELWKLISQVQRLSNDKLIRCQDYTMMSKDGTIGSALEMMADDASQPDEFKGKTIWITSENDALETELNDFIDNVVNIEPRVWNWSYNIACYGELFLKTYYVEMFANRRKRYIAANKLNEDDLKPEQVTRRLTEKLTIEDKKMGLTESSKRFLLEDFPRIQEDCEVKNNQLKIMFMDKESEQRINGNRGVRNPLHEALSSFVKSNSIHLSGEAKEEGLSLIETLIAEAEKGKKKGKEQDEIDASEFYFEEVSPEDIYHLFFRGQPCGYIVLSDISSVRMIGHPMYYPEGEYIHFMAERYWFKDDLIFKYQDPNSKETVARKYTVRSGSSFIDKARMPYRVMKLLDDILLLTRLARSSTFIVHFVEVGNSGAQETMKIMKGYRDGFKTSEKFSIQDKLYASTSSPVPQNDQIFIAVRNGKGVSTFQRVGGDVEFSNMVDVDYFRNKLYGSIKVPKAFLGFEEEVPGSLGNTSLVRLDLRYARTIKGIQKSIKGGVRSLCDFYLMVTGRKVKTSDYKVCMANITSAEDTDKINELTSRLQVTDSVNNMTTNYEEYLDKGKVIQFLVKDILRIAKDLYKDEFNGDPTSKPVKKEEPSVEDEISAEEEPTVDAEVSAEEVTKEEEPEKEKQVPSAFPSGKVEVPLKNFTPNTEEERNPFGSNNSPIDVETEGDLPSNSMWSR